MWAWNYNPSNEKQELQINEKFLIYRSVNGINNIVKLFSTLCNQKKKYSKAIKNGSSWCRRDHSTAFYFILCVIHRKGEEILKRNEISGFKSEWNEGIKVNLRKTCDSWINFSYFFMCFVFFCGTWCELHLSRWTNLLPLSFRVTFFCFANLSNFFLLIFMTHVAHIFWCCTLEWREPK